jgi:hypothetical protein
MRWIALFNIAYGGLGLAAALYLGRTDGIALCLWVMACGVAIRFARPALLRWRTSSRRRRAVARARLG